jgi:hypothetical protein
MKRRWLYAALLSIPLLLIAVAWEAGRFDSLADETRRLESAQQSWVDENEKLGADILVMSSRQRTADLADSLGLEKAGPERRLRIVLPARANGAGND